MAAGARGVRVALLVGLAAFIVSMNSFADEANDPSMETAPIARDGDVAEPSTYRMDDYRAPTPSTLTGAVVVDTIAAERLFRAGTAVFVDTLPRAPKPAGLPETTIWRPKARGCFKGIRLYTQTICWRSGIAYH